MTKRDTVLVIDDDPSFREMVTLMAGILGVRVATAENGMAGLKVLKQESDRVGLVLLDYFMPGMSPASCAARLVEQAGASIPIVLVTAAANPASRAAELKLTHWLAKPFEMSALESLFRAAGILKCLP